MRRFFIRGWERPGSATWGKWAQSEDDEKEMRESIPVTRSASSSIKQPVKPEAKSVAVVSARMKRAFAAWKAAGNQIPALAVGAAANALVAGEECVDPGADGQLVRAQDEYALLLAERQKALTRYAIGEYRGSRAMRDRAADDLDSITDMLARLLKRDEADVGPAAAQDARRVLDTENALALDEARSILQGNRVIIADDLADLYLRNEGDMIGDPGTTAKSRARGPADNTSLQNVAVLFAPALGVSESEAARRWKKTTDSYNDAVRILAAQGETARFDSAADAAVADVYALGLDIDVRSSAFIKARLDPYDDRRYLAYSPDGAVCDGPVCGDADVDECADDYDPCADSCSTPHCFKYVVVNRDSDDQCKKDSKQSDFDMQKEREHEERVRELQRRIAQLEQAQNDAQQRELERCREEENQRRADVERRAEARDQRRVQATENDCDYRWVWDTDEDCEGNVDAVEAPEHACGRPLCQRRFASMTIPAGVRLSGPGGNNVDSSAFDAARAAMADFVESTRLVKKDERAALAAGFASRVWQGAGSDATTERHAFSTLLLYMLKELFDVILCNKSCRAIILAADIAASVRELANGSIPRNSPQSSSESDRAAAQVLDYLVNGPRINERSDRFELTQRDAPYFLDDTILFPHELAEVLGASLGYVAGNLDSLRKPHGNFVRTEWQTVAESMEARLGPLMPKDKQPSQPQQQQPRQQQQQQEQQQRQQQQRQQQQQQQQEQQQRQQQQRQQQQQQEEQQRQQQQRQQQQRQQQQQQSRQQQQQQPAQQQPRQQQPAQPQTPSPEMAPAQAELQSDSEASDEFEELQQQASRSPMLPMARAGAAVSEKRSRALAIISEFANKKAAEQARLSTVKSASVTSKKSKAKMDLASIIADLKK